MPYVWGFVAVGVLWIIAGVTTGSWRLLKYVEGADGRPSTSKFQWLFWTVIVYFAYTVLYAARARYGYVEALAQIPENVLYIVTFSTATMATAKGVTAAYVQSGRVVKAPPAPGQQGMSALLNDDTQAPDLSKIQMLAWTVLIGTIYLSRVVQMVQAYGLRENDLSQLPDVDRTLMVLMGLGQGGYLGKKIAS